MENNNGKLGNGNDTELFILKDGDDHDTPSPTPSKKHKFGSHEHLIKKKDDYKSTFTVHGLTRICTGSRPEAMFWLFMLLIGIGCTTYVVHRMVTKYLKYEIYTEVHQKLATKNYFPAITFCDQDKLRDHYFAYCGHFATQDNKGKILKMNFPCTENLKTFEEINDTLDLDTEWTNGKVHVSKCFTWGSSMCGTDDKIKSLTKQGHECFTWNHNGDFHDPYSHAFIEFKINNTSPDSQPPKIAAFIHEPTIDEIDTTNRVVLEPGRTYELSIRKNSLIRLPFPFPSKCVENVPNQIFPGKYTRRTCLESINYVEMYKYCGDIFDYHKKLIPDHILQKYKRNVSMSEAYTCMNTFSKQKISINECPFPCHEMDYQSTATCHGLDGKNDPNNTFIYRVDIQLQNVDSYRVIEEKQLYTWDQVLGEVGGLVGLVIGASVISFIEILCFLYLWCVDKCCTSLTK